MSNVKVKMEVKAHATGDLYVCGSTKAFGEWDPAKAAKLEYCAESGTYKLNKMLPLNDVVEYKVLSGKDWDCVEKTSEGYEVENHSFVVEKGLVVELEVAKFNK